jgi:hypothetical protein
VTLKETWVDSDSTALETQLPWMIADHARPPVGLRCSYALQRSIDRAAISNDKDSDVCIHLSATTFPLAGRQSWASGQKIPLKPVKTEVSTTHRAPGEQGKPAGGLR